MLYVLSFHWVYCILILGSCKHRGILLFKQFWVKCGIFHKSNKNSMLPCLIRIYLNWKVIFTGTIWVLNNFWKIFGGHDICKMVMNFLLIINFQCIFIIFHSWMPPKLLNWENYRLSIGIFRNRISKCNRLSDHMRHKIAIEVLYGLRNKQKKYLIFRETPCSFVMRSISGSDFDAVKTNSVFTTSR